MVLSFLRERRMQAAVALSPWFQAPSPFRTPVTARAIVHSLLITPTGPTAASSRTAAACTSLKSLVDATLTRSAPGCSGSSFKTQQTRTQVRESAETNKWVWLTFNLSSGWCVQGPGGGDPGERPAGRNSARFSQKTHITNNIDYFCNTIAAA